MASRTIRYPQPEELGARWVLGNEEWGFYTRIETLEGSDTEQSNVKMADQTQWNPLVTFLRTPEEIELVFHYLGD